MALTEKRIAALEEKGFSRWTKGNFDRLYINASALGLHCDYYKTGNISNAVFQGTSISNCEGRRMKAAKTYIDVKTGEIHSDNYTLEKAVKALVEELDEQDAAEEAAKAAETVTEQKTDDSKDMLIIAVQDWEADQQYDDLIVDYNDIGQTDDGEWYVTARDNDHSYMLVQDSEGNIHMV